MKIRVKGTAPVNQKVIVNGGVIAQRNDTMFTAEIIIEDKETEITATAGDYLGQNHIVSGSFGTGILFPPATA